MPGDQFGASTSHLPSIEPRSIGRILGDGFVVGIGNPKTIVFFSAVLPQLVDQSAGDVPVQMLVKTNRTQRLSDNTANP